MAPIEQTILRSQDSESELCCRESLSLPAMRPISDWRPHGDIPHRLGHSLLPQDVPIADTKSLDRPVLRPEHNALTVRRDGDTNTTAPFEFGGPVVDKNPEPRSGRCSRSRAES